MDQTFPSSGVYVPLASSAPWPKSLPGQNDHQAAMHHQLKDRRERYIRLFESRYDPRFKRLAERMNLCEHFAQVAIDCNTGRTRRVSFRCGTRYCPRCGSMKSSHDAARIESLIVPMDQPKHIVLTLKHTHDPLSQQLRRFRQSFKVARDDRVWKEHVPGGIYTMEIKYDCSTCEYHVHAHVLASGPYFPQPMLKNLWKRATRDTYIVWVSQVTDPHDGAQELAKYVGKPVDVDKWPDEKIIEYAEAVHGMHMIQTFGNLHGGTKHEPVELNEKPSLEKRFDLSHLVWLAGLGFKNVAQFLILWAQRYPDERRYIRKKLPHLKIPLTSVEQLRRSWRKPGARAPPHDLVDQRQAEIERLEPELSRVALLIVQEDDQDLYAQAEMDAQVIGHAA